MTPQSELQRLLGIPPELWEGELKGMSVDVRFKLYCEGNNLQSILFDLLHAIADVTRESTC